jgi:hypothetical protein
MIGVSEARRAALVAAGLTIPNFVPIRGLIDTGASCTCLDPTVIAALQLPQTGSVSMLTPSTGATPHATAQYDASLFIPSVPNQAPLSFPTIPIVASDLVGQGIHALLGRDILSRCVLHYNGGAPAGGGLFTLAF